MSEQKAPVKRPVDALGNPISAGMSVLFSGRNGVLIRCIVSAVHCYKHEIGLLTLQREDSEPFRHSDAYPDDGLNFNTSDFPEINCYGSSVVVIESCEDKNARLVAMDDLLLKQSYEINKLKKQLINYSPLNFRSQTND